MNVRPMTDGWTRAGIVLAGVALAVSALFGVAGRTTPSATSELPRIVTARPLATPSVAVAAGASALTEATTRPTPRSMSAGHARPRPRGKAGRPSTPRPGIRPASSLTRPQTAPDRDGDDDHEVVAPDVREDAVSRDEE